jgi:hypothetical protein
VKNLELLSGNIRNSVEIKQPSLPQGPRPGKLQFSLGNQKKRKSIAIISIFKMPEFH